MGVAAGALFGPWISTIYVSAGAQFGALQSPADMLTSGLVAALAALASAPFAAKVLALAWSRNRWSAP